MKAAVNGGLGSMVAGALRASTVTAAHIPENAGELTTWPMVLGGKRLSVGPHAKPNAHDGVDDHDEGLEDASSQIRCEPSSQTGPASSHEAIQDHLRSGGRSEKYQWSRAGWRTVRALGVWN